MPSLLGETIRVKRFWRSDSTQEIFGFRIQTIDEGSNVCILIYFEHCVNHYVRICTVQEKIISSQDTSRCFRSSRQLSLHLPPCFELNIDLFETTMCHHVCPTSKNIWASQKSRMREPFGGLRIHLLVHSL